MSNFAHTPFKHPEDGYFQLVEGYWYWLLSSSFDPRRENLRNLYGFAAKKLGRQLSNGKNCNDAEWLKDKIFTAMWCKTCQNPEFKQMLLEQEWLPFEHYYVYNGKAYEPERGKWILDYWKTIKYLLEIGQEEYGLPN